MRGAECDGVAGLVLVPAHALCRGLVLPQEEQVVDVHVYLEEWLIGVGATQGAFEHVREGKPTQGAFEHAREGQRAGGGGWGTHKTSTMVVPHYISHSIPVSRA